MQAGRQLSGGTGQVAGIMCVSGRVRRGVVLMRASAPETPAKPSNILLRLTHATVYYCDTHNFNESINHLAEQGVMGVAGVCTLQ